eukprot:1151662-Pelagomonas_calceolata.AAC.3
MRVNEGRGKVKDLSNAPQTLRPYDFSKSHPHLCSRPATAPGCMRTHRARVHAGHLCPATASAVHTAQLLLLPPHPQYHCPPAPHCPLRQRLDSHGTKACLTSCLAGRGRRTMGRRQSHLRVQGKQGGT